jgi:hypothetical protein
MVVVLTQEGNVCILKLDPHTEGIGAVLDIGSGVGYTPRGAFPEGIPAFYG